MCIERSVFLHAPEKESRSNAFVAINEAVVLDKEIKQMSGFFFKSRVDVMTFKGLNYCGE